jgi:hypothetical protein
MILYDLNCYDKLGKVNKCVGLWHFLKSFHVLTSGLEPEPHRVKSQDPDACGSGSATFI